MLRSGRMLMTIAFGKQKNARGNVENEVKMVTDKNSTKQRCGPFCNTNMTASELNVEKKEPFVKVQQKENVERKSFKHVEMHSETRDAELVQTLSGKADSALKFCGEEFSDYVDDVYEYLKKIECKSCLPEDFLSKDDICTRLSRSILLDWLVQVQCHLHLLDETLHLTVTLTDRFLSLSPICLDNLQLLGITCLLLASKMEEIDPPEISMLCFLTDHSYKKSAVLQMEMIVLRTLAFDFCLPSCVHFYDLYTNSEAFQIDDPTLNHLILNLGKYIMDLSICTTTVLPFPPSQRAAAAIALSRKIMLTGNKTAASSPAWTPALVQATGYVEVELMPCMRTYATLLSKATYSKQQAARTKYSSISRYCGLSQLPIVTKSFAVQQLAMTRRRISKKADC